jgi:hypothetical protein
MNIAQAHMDIARERFLELMAANPNNDARDTAIAAIEQADEFTAVYGALGYKAVEPAPVSKKLKGCRACHGSGGKQFDPCKACAGTGKVAA